MSEFKVGDKVRFRGDAPLPGNWEIESKINKEDTVDLCDDAWRLCNKWNAAKTSAREHELTYVGSSTDWIEAFRNAKPEELKEIAELLWPIMMTLPINCPHEFTIGERVLADDLPRSRYCIDSTLAPGMNKTIIVSQGREFEK